MIARRGDADRVYRDGPGGPALHGVGGRSRGGVGVEECTPVAGNVRPQPMHVPQVNQDESQSDDAGDPLEGVAVVAPVRVMVNVGLALRPNLQAEQAVECDGEEDEDDLDGDEEGFEGVNAVDGLLVVVGVACTQGDETVGTQMHDQKEADGYDAGERVQPAEQEIVRTA